MGIVGYNIISVKAERKKMTKPLDSLNINSTVKISGVESLTLPDGLETLGINFEFTTDYNPEVASFTVSGEVLFADKTSKSILKTWVKDKKLPERIDADIKNFIFRKGLTMGIQMSEEMQLPPPIVFPMVMPKKDEDKTKYIG